MIDTGNPVYPLGYRVFGGRHWDEAREASGRTPTARRPITAGALELAWSTSPAGPTGSRRSTSRFAPLALLRPRLAATGAGALAATSAYSS